MGVNWDSRSIEFRLLFYRYNKLLHHEINTNSLNTFYFGTIASAAADNQKMDKLSERIKKLQDFNTGITDSMMYGSIKRQKAITDAERMAAKIDFLTKVRPIAFKGF